MGRPLGCDATAAILRFKHRRSSVLLYDKRAGTNVAVGAFLLSMLAADARNANTLYPIPETFKDHSVTELLTAAAYGRVGVDKRLIQSIFDRGEAAMPEVVKFAGEPFADDENTANLTRHLFLLLRHYRTPLALPFLMALVKANLEELPEELMEAVLEIGPSAVDPILALYDEVDEDELRGEIAFLLASFRNRDPRILKRVLDYFEYDTADGAIILDSFGDPGAIPAIEKVLAEPALEAEMKAELEDIADSLREDHPPDEPPPPYDALAEYEDTEEPIYDILADYELMAMLSSPSEEYRTGAVDNLSSQDLTPTVVLRVHQLARTDPSPRLRGRAWEALAGDPDDKAIIAEMSAILEDVSKPVEERTGTLVALASLNKYSRIKEALLDFYHSFPEHRPRVIKAMWRTLDKAWGKYMSEGLASSNDDVREQAILGIGNLQLSSEADKIEALFGHEHLRPAALYAYALAAPGETSRVRMKSLFTLIEKLADGLDEQEAELVEQALDERLAIKGMKPVFHVEGDEGHDHSQHDPSPASNGALPKAGRNDPCPCGSGKKYKKCHGQ